jgi:hypothetical protein
LKPQTFLIAHSSEHAMICLALNFLLISSSKKHRVTHEFGAGFVCFVFYRRARTYSLSSVKSQSSKDVCRVIRMNFLPIFVFVYLSSKQTFFLI